MPLASDKSLRFALRDGTRPAHERLDRLASLFELYDQDDYGAFLVWHARLVPTLEQQLTQRGLLPIFPEWPEHRRAEFLLEDIEALGLSRPFAEPYQVGTTAPELIGVAYVLEGSRLGGAVLSRSVDPALRGTATRYLDHGEGLKLWPRFVSRLDTLDFSGAETKAAVAAANAVFAAFERALTHDEVLGAVAGL
ncbi:biliverdin-producing heme oxygenase [Pelagibacterium luteolum]|uniref:Heme oxygenase n=1 Tax=Pelagibacterium luteolum TaxID=440168 RepID=A0A1G7RRJ4_9HYPH|nr:biliverdin-producing heme oxygenase [Pelagibacterium luteolum]SDG12530.1 Heme oxygenase [Pelagibacterium luteolum]